MELVQIFDPTTPSKSEKINFALRPKELKGLKVGLIDNSKYNSDTLLLRIAERLKRRFHMEMVLLHRKQSPAAHITEEAIDEFKEKADFVIAGIGD